MEVDVSTALASNDFGSSACFLKKMILVPWPELGERQ
jgi:hypothetical protein